MSDDFEGYRVSPAQQHLHRLRSGLPGTDPFTVRIEATLPATADPEHLRRTLLAQVADHEILRTRVCAAPGTGVPAQVIAEQPQLGDHEGEDGGAPLSLSVTPLADGTRRLSLSADPACADPATLLRLLAVALGRTTDEGDEEPVQYADVAEWFHQLLDEPETAAARDRWRRLSAIGPATTDLPLGPGAPDAFRPESVAVVLDPATSRRVAARAVELGVQEGALTAAAWALVLADGTDGDAVRLGVTVDGRGAPELQGAPGPYDRTVPVEVPVGGPDTAALIRAADAALQEAAADADVFRWDTAAPAAGREPYCPFSAGHLDVSALLGDGTVTDLAVVDATDRYALRLLAVRHTAARLELRLGFDAHRCARPVAELLAARAATAMAALCTERDVPLDGIDLMTAQDTALLRSHGTGELLPHSDDTVLDLIRAHVLARPDAPAVTSHDGRLSYAALDAAADALAAHLRAAGCAPGDRVALCVRRGVLLPVAVLAVLRCGAAYLPLDGRNPAERLAGMVTDAGARVLLADDEGRQALAGQLPELPVVHPEAAWSAGRPEAEDRPEAAERPEVADRREVVDRVAPDTAAYVIFTSGSTGRPKGVEVTHRNLAHSTRARLHVYRPGTDSAALLIPTIAFDSSVATLFGTLCAGGCLVVPGDKEATDPTELARLAVEHGVTDLLCVPSLYRALLDEFAGTDGLPVRRAMVAGEACPPSLVERHHHVLPGATLFNEYGPTEATVWCTVQPLVPGGTERVPIGRPTPGTRIHVVGPDGAQVPFGSRGELYVGGPGVAAGYVGRPELTAERFLPDRFGAVPDARVYRTGDLVRFRPDGALEFLGRTDRQVKVRGFRVELEEIESRIAAQPGVTAVAVVDRRDESGTVTLAAHAVLRAPATAESVRAAVARALPAYMVPTLDAVPALPELPNGKVDYAALRLAAPARPAAPYRAPRNPVEQALAEVWQQVLDVDRVGIDDNFFDSGGDSIRVVQVRTGARRQGLLLQVTDLMQHPTIGALAPLVTAVGEGAGSDPAVPAAALLPDSVRAQLPEGVEDAWPLSSLQAGMLFHTAFERGDRLLYHDVTTLHLRSPLDPEAFARAVDALCSRHQMLRVGFDMAHPAGPLQLVHRSVATPLRVIDLRSAGAEERRSRVAADVEAERCTPFGREQAPLVRFVLHRLDEDEFQLTLAVHHAVLDGWSVTVLLSELMDCYLHLTDPAHPAPAPAPAASYARFLALEQAALAGEDAQWWARRTEDLPDARLGGSALSDGSGGQRRGTELPAETCEALRRVAQRAGVPLKSALLAVHLKVLATMTGRDDVVTGMVTNCRPEDEEGSEAMLGLFLNTLPLRTVLPRGSWLDLLGHVFAQEREMLPHRWYPMSRIRQDRGTDALFEAAFNYIHFHRYGDLSTRPGLQVLDARFHGDTNLPLMTDFIQDPVSGRIELSIAFDPSRYGPAFIDAMADRYHAALTALTTAPEGAHTASALLSDAERDRLAATGHGPSVRPPAATVLPQLAAVLAHSGDRPAIEAAGRSVGYDELAAAARACGAAARASLATADAGTEPTVALLLPRGPELVTAALGCLLSGVPFVVCDPTQDPARLRAMLRDARAGLAVAAEPDRLTAALPPGVPCRTPEWLRTAAAPGPDADPGPEHLAYLVFTSGSTGRPKPVAVSHRALANRLGWSQREYPLHSEDRVLALAAPVFDFAVWELFAPLLAGACLLPAPELAESSTGLGELLRDTGTTVTHLVPSLLGGLVGDPALADCHRLRLLLVGGEAFPARLLEQLQSVLGWCEVIHQYGPAEAAIDATFHRAGPAGSASAGIAPAGGAAATVPIGRPIDNVSVHVLGENLLPVPPGCVGELFLGGEAPARGYHGRPGPTAEAFLPDPWATTPGARMYRTGDLARQLPDGSLEFLGRTDHQVQVNGVRVELGEIEAALYAGGLVAEAAVVAHRADRGGLRLVAHLVLRPGVDVRAEEVLAGLDGLPDALRPSRAVVHTALPRTASGKTDLRALRAAELPGRPRPVPVAADTELERTLTALWSDVLGTPDIGVQDDFFDLGGDSILALQLVARARRDETALTPRLIYAHRTIRAVARALDGPGPSRTVATPGDTPAQAAPALVALSQEGGGTPFFCVHASDGSAAPYAALADALPRRRPFFGLDAEGLRPDGPELASVPALAAHYLTQVRSRQPHGPYLLGGWSTGAAVAFEMAAQLRAQGERVDALVLLDPAIPPRLPEPPRHEQVLWLFLRDLAGMAGRPMPPLDVDQLRSLEHRARTKAVLGAIREAALVPDEITDQLAARMAVFSAMVSGAAVWQPAPYDGPLTLLVAGDAAEARQRLTGWRPFTTGTPTAHPVDGTHHSMLRRPALTGLATAVDRCLTPDTEPTPGS
ncbi:amino acid adenylation domain-containing protein [Streptomyces sioyaensis]|uniref:amino acid adenylation domain-containing protein n=1 Tax=Streptomyces sioyaensis TaxID=67364 RepID=UPI0037D739F4